LLVLNTSFQLMDFGCQLLIYHVLYYSKLRIWCRS